MLLCEFDAVVLVQRGAKHLVTTCAMLVLDRVGVPFFSSSFQLKEHGRFAGQETTRTSFYSNENWNLLIASCATDSYRTLHTGCVN